MTKLSRVIHGRFHFGVVGFGLASRRLEFAGRDYKNKNNKGEDK